MTGAMNTVPLGTLKIGDAFTCPWRRAGHNFGEVIDVGVSGCSVRVRDTEDGGLYVSYWSKDSQVVVATREDFNRQTVVLGDRNRSAADNPVQRVHEICAEMKDKTRDEKIARCVSEGINANTAKTQYYAWRKTLSAAERKALK